MRKKNPVRPIPPLSLGALAELEKIEELASFSLQGCVNRLGVLVNPEKAKRILRTRGVAMIARNNTLSKLVPR